MMERELGTATAYTPPQTQQTTLPDTLTIQGRNFSVSHLLNLENVDFSDPASLDQVHSVAAAAAAAQHHQVSSQVGAAPRDGGVMSDTSHDDGEFCLFVASSICFSLGLDFQAKEDFARTRGI